MIVIMLLLVVLLAVGIFFVSGFDLVLFGENMYLTMYLLKKVFEECERDSNFILKLYMLLQRGALIAHQRNYRPTLTFRNMLMIMYNFVTLASDKDINTKWSQRQLLELDPVVS